MGESKQYLIYGGKSSKDFNIWISGSGTFDAPQRDVSRISVPGRNGDLVMDNGRFENVNMTYSAFIPRDFPENMAGFRSWAKSMTGYQRLEDTYHPDVFYQAILIDSFDPETSPYNRAGTFDITFNRKPQRWLKSGEDFLPTITAATTLMNPTYFSSKPLIRVRGTGTFYIGSIPVTVVTNPTYIDIDCDLMNCYNGLTNLNNYVELQNNHFPELPSGSVGVTLGTITSLQIKPRWWTL